MTAQPVLDLQELRRRFPGYEIDLIGLTWYAWRCDGTRTGAVKADTPEGLRRAILADIPDRPRIPHQRAS